MRNKRNNVNAVHVAFWTLLFTKMPGVFEMHHRGEPLPRPHEELCSDPAAVLLSSRLIPRHEWADLYGWQ